MVKHVAVYINKFIFNLIIILLRFSHYLWLPFDGLNLSDIFQDKNYTENNGVTNNAFCVTLKIEANNSSYNHITAALKGGFHAHTC